MKKFEYMSHTTNQGEDWPGWRGWDCPLDLLNEFGQEGWELIEVWPTVHYLQRQYIFKRQIIT